MKVMENLINDFHMWIVIL